MSETILIVDDEKEIADLVELYLKNEKYHIEKVADSATALGILEKKRVSLALLDVMLPDMDGFTLCKKIREKHLFPIIINVKQLSFSVIFDKGCNHFFTDRCIGALLFCPPKPEPTWGFSALFLIILDNSVFCEVSFKWKRFRPLERRHL